MCSETRLISFLLDIGWLHQMITQEATLRAPEEHSKQKIFLLKAYSCLHRQGILTSSIFYLHMCEKRFYKERSRDRECKPLQYTAFHIFLKLGKSSWIFKELIRSSASFFLFALCNTIQNPEVILLSDLATNILFRLKSSVKNSEVHSWLWIQVALMVRIEKLLLFC